MQEKRIPHLNIGENLFSDLSKRRVIEYGVEGKSLLRKKDHDFYGQMASRYDHFNNVLACHEMIDLVQ